MDKQQTNVPRVEETASPDDAGSVAVSEEAAADSEAAGQTLKLVRFLPHDPQDTANAVADTVSRLGYSADVVTQLTNWDADQIALIKAQLPAEILTIIENSTPEIQSAVLGKMYPAFYHNGKIFINAQSVRPSEVPRVLAHEAGLHFGLRAAFKANMDTLLDNIYADNFDNPELARIVKEYNLAEAEVDEEGKPLFDGEGNQIFKELSEENRRIAAEEFLADLAETGGYDYRKVYADNQADIDAFAKENNIDIHNLADRRQLVKDWAAATGYTVQKPNWFKRMISNIRIWFHNHGIMVKHFSDDDIANIIFRSAKAARDRRRTASRDGDGVRFLAEPFTEAQKRDILAMTPKNGVDVMKKILYGGSITRNGNTVHFDGKNSHALKLHLDAEGFKPSKGPVTPEEVERFLPLALAQTPKPSETKNKRNRKTKNKKYRISVDGIRYTLVTSWKGFFRSFYSNKRAPGEVNSQKAGSASSPEHINNISQNPENASSTDKNGPSAAPDGAMEGKRTGTDRSDKSDGNGALFTLNSNASEELKLQVKAMQDCVGPFLDQDGAEYARRFKEKYGITLDPDEAIVIAQLAISENRSARQKYVAAQNAVNAWAYFKSFNPLFDFIVGFAGEDFKINPGMAFAGDEFTGTFITPEYRKYSVKRRQKPNESDAAYRKYLAKRDKALAKVSGTQLDEVAQAYARESGRELKDVQEEIIDLLRNLQRTDIISQYKKYKDELLSEDDFMQQERYRIEDEVISILESGRPVVNPEFVKNNRAVYKELYKKMFGKEAPFSPGKKDIEAINAALVQEGANAATYAQAYKAARKVAWEEMQNKLAELKDKIFKGNQDAARLQREAATFAHKHLERENRGEFINGIVGLLKYPTAPTNKYPEGRRQHEFDRLLDKMRQRAKNIRRDHFISEIHKMLEQNRSRRTAKNVPYSPMGERQTALDRINLISRMNPETVLVLRSFAAEQVAALQDQLDGMMDSGDDVERAQEIARLQSELKKNENDLFYLEHYGNLDMKTPEAVQKSFDMLKKFIQSGREEFMTTMMERALRIRQTREKLRSEMTLGDLNVPDRRFLDLTRNYAKEFAVSSLSDTQLLREFSRISDDADFYRSEHGKILKMIEDSSELEQTLKREAQAKLDEFFKEKGLKSLVERGKFLRSLTKVQDTGIVIDVYGATRIAENQPKNVTPENLVKYSNFSAGRPVTSATFVLEHARKILEDINSDTAVNGIVRVGDLENAKKLYSELRKIENAPDTVSGKRYTVAITKNGLRVYADTNGNEVVAFDLAEPTPFLAELLKDKRQIFKLDDIAIASATARIHEYDAGVDIYQERDMGDDIDSAAMKAYFDSDGNDHSVRRIKIQSADPTALKQQKTLSVSPEQAVQIILTAEQPYYKTNMTFNGFTEEKISAIKEWLQKNHPGALEMGYALRDIVKKQNPQLDAAVFERYGVHLPEHENFWYADFKGSVRTQIQDAGFGNSAGGMTVSANFLTARRFHTLPIDIQSGFVSLFMRKQMETAHFIAWSKTVRELRSLYSSIDVQNVLIKEFGNDAWNVWKKRIELLATGGDPGKIYDNIANYFNEMFFPANIALNMKSVASQFAGGVAYSLYVPPHELLKRIAIDRNSAQYQKFISQVKISGYLANRANGGFDPAIRRMTDVFRKKNISPLSDALLEKSLALTTWSDQKGALFWGYMAYDYFLKHGMAKGMSKAEAEQYAFQMWKRATDETQQSGAMKDRNSFNINSGAMRAVTAYMTSPMQQLGLEISSIRKYIKDKTPENRNEMIRRIVVNHILVTTSMNFIASAFRHGINFADYLDDWEDYVAGWILGNFDAIWYLGKTIRGIVTGNFFDRQPRSLVPIVDNLSRDFSNIANDISGKSEVQWLDYLQATGDVLMSAGPAASRTIGMGLYVSSREIRRIMRWLEASKPKRKKSWF
ncbi:MAG: hypothetical protein IJY46_07740 [Lentisphaeria bacterium]|nr:hypothetical protein [Lentisphaeria bacterium]